MKKNTFLNGIYVSTFAIVFTKILGVIYVIPFYQMIQEESISLYGYAYTIYDLFLSLSTVGIPPAISKIISEYNALEYYNVKERVYKIGKKIALALGIIIFIVLNIFAKNVAYAIIGKNLGGNTIEDITFVIRVISTAIIIVPLLSVSKGYLQGHKYITPSSVSQVIEQIVRIVFLLVGTYTFIYLFHLGTTKAIGIAIFSTTISALSALTYILLKIKNNKKQLKTNEEIKAEENKISNKTIVKKIITYAIPFILIGITSSIYQTIDITTVVKTLASKLDYLTKDAESIIGVMTTTGNKLNSIIIAVATGLSISLIPYITSSVVKKDIPEVKNKIFKSIFIIILISLPLALGLSFLSTPTFYAFYGENTWGAIVFKVSIWTAIAKSMFLITSSILQSISKFKVLYFSIPIGTLVKIIINVPMMKLFASNNIYPFYGAILSTILALMISTLINIYYINKSYPLEIKKTFKTILKILYPLATMYLVLLITREFIPLTFNSRMGALLICLIYALIGGIVYIGLTYQNKTIQEILEIDFKKLKLRKKQK